MYKMKVYISGAITSDPDYKNKFAAAADKLQKEGHRVFNPTCLPDIFNYNEFMTIDLCILRQCDAIFMLKDWKESPGAKLEYETANKRGMAILFEE